MCHLVEMRSLAFGNANVAEEAFLKHSFSVE